MSITGRLGLIIEVARSPSVTIDCFGDQYAKATWRTFTKRHPKLPLFRTKSFGAAVRKVPDGNDILEGSQFVLMRRKVKKAEKAGYTFSQINPNELFEQILTINTSSQTRQGRAIGDQYTNLEKLKSYHSLPGNWFGVFDRDQNLQAYTHVPIIGDVFIYSRILGNSDALNDGIMYVLIAETLRYMATLRDRDGHPNWAMYDMYIGGGDGLREFKLRTGFKPMRVNWRWTGN